MNKKYAFLAFLAIVALASFFRLWEIKSIPPGFYPDEAMNGNNANEAWQTKDFKIFYPENNGREGLWINMMAPLLAILGNEPWVPRTMAAIFGILTVLGLYFLAKMLFRSERVALLASFFLAASFWHITLSRISFPAIMSPFFLVWSFYFLWRVIAKKPDFSSSASILKKINDPTANPKEEKSTFSLVVLSALSGLLFGLGFHTYIAYRIAPLLLIIPFILMWRKEQKKAIIVFLLFTFIAALPIGIYFLENPQNFLERTSQVSVLSSKSPLAVFGVNIVKTIGMFFWKGDSNWRHNFSGRPELWWPVAILFLIGIVSSFKRPFSWKKVFMMMWLAIMILPMIISSEGTPHALRSLVVIPAVMIFAALGLEWIIVKISDWLRKKTEQYPEKREQLLRIKKELSVLLIIFLLAVASEAFNQYFLRWANNPNVRDAYSENYVELGKYLLTLPENVPKYVIVNAGGVDVYGIPMPAQTTMFITKTFLPDWQNEKNIFYVNTKDIDSFADEARQKEYIYITSLENDPALYASLKEKIPGLKIDASSGILVLYK